jgi:hypothetical protein
MAKFDVKLKSVELPELPPVVAKPLYAGVGATDIAVQKVITYVADVQAKVTANVADLQKDVTTKVVEVQKAVRSFELPEPRTLQGKATQVVAERRKVAESRLAEIQTEAKSLPTTVKVKYDQNVTLVTSTYAGLAKHGETVLTRIRKGETAAPVEVTKKVPARKAPAKKASTASTSKAPAKRASTAKKAPAKKATAQKTSASS